MERLRQELAIQAVAKRKYKATTDSKPTQPVADNHLNRDFTVERPNTWVADITYLYTQEGWLYLATIMDLYSRKIIGWAFKGKINQRLSDSSPGYDLKQRNLSPELLLPSDRGSQ